MSRDIPDPSCGPKTASVERAYGSLCLCTHRTQTRERIILLLQLFVTLLVLGFLPGNGLKLAAMIAIWWIGFKRVSTRELIAMACVNILFSLMDIAASRSGVFYFRHPDLLGLPVYEFVLWGFYTLHAMRFIGRAPADPRVGPAILLAILFAVPFATITDSNALLSLSSMLLVLSLVIFRDPIDFAYSGYLIAVGCVVEFLGVWTGQWGYPGAPLGGVALWFIPMWGGVGLFTGRLLAPLLVGLPG